MISLLTLILLFASNSCNNKDIILILGYNYNLHHRSHVFKSIMWPKHAYDFNTMMMMMMSLHCELDQTIFVWGAYTENNK